MTDDLGVDSMTMLEVVVALEDRFGVLIPDDDLGAVLDGRRPRGSPRADRGRCAHMTGPPQEARRRRTVTWVVGLATLGLVFDGYDLVVYGTVVSTFLRNPGEIGQVTPAAAGALGSYALVGVLVGALTAGAIGDIIGRRKIMLVSYAWFAVFMGFTALASGTAMFGLGRFLTGIGVGALVGTTGAIVAEFAPPGKKNLCNAITYSGVPFGSLLAALLGILLLGAIGWRGMFWIGAVPLVTLLPLAYFKMPESVAWLVSRGPHRGGPRGVRTNAACPCRRSSSRSGRPTSARRPRRTRRTGGVRRAVRQPQLASAPCCSG